MKPPIFSMILLALAVPAFAQLRLKISIDAQTPEGRMLQEIGQEQDETRKAQTCEQFLEKYPKHEAVPWVLGALQPVYLKTKQFDKAIAVGEKLLTLDPEDAEIGHHTLEAAEGKKDPDLIMLWSNRTSEIAGKVAAKPKPPAEEKVANWESSVDYAKQVDVYTEYSLYRAVLETPDPQKKITLGETLLKRNPDSRYVPQMADQWLLAYQQTGNLAGATAMSEAVLAKDPAHETGLIVAADGAFNGKDYRKAADYGGKLISLMSTKPKPQGMSDADWEKKKSLTTGLGNWYAGMSYAAQSNWPQADKSLRVAIPLLKDNNQLLAAALFNAGLANHNMKKMTDAAGFFEQCAKISGPFQGQAQMNLKAIRGR